MGARCVGAPTWRGAAEAVVVSTWRVRTRHVLLAGGDTQHRGDDRDEQKSPRHAFLSVVGRVLYAAAGPGAVFWGGQPKSKRSSI